MGYRTFLSKNMVVIVMVPVLAGAHYGWYKLQFNDKFVTAEERESLPLLKAQLAQEMSQPPKI